MIEASCGVMGGCSSLYVTTFPSLVAICIVVVDMFLICHVVSQDYAAQGTCDFLGRSPSIQVIILPSLVGLWWWKYNSCSLIRDLQPVTYIEKSTFFDIFPSLLQSVEMGLKITPKSCCKQITGSCHWRGSGGLNRVTFSFSEKKALINRVL